MTELSEIHSEIEALTHARTGLGAMKPGQANATRQVQATLVLAKAVLAVAERLDRLPGPATGESRA